VIICALALYLNENIVKPCNQIIFAPGNMNACFDRQFVAGVKFFNVLRNQLFDSPLPGVFVQEAHLRGFDSFVIVEFVGAGEAR